MQSIVVLLYLDIYAYKGDNKTPDDALDAISAAYLMLSLGYKDSIVHFGNQKFTKIFLTKILVFAIIYVIK
ncbi:hypothetical protein QIA41_05470 (plasmid) [Borreliella sinica]|uniref:hypothetical protein n=1 Tax=Borreliella sinica TaxID=87162 RepID=UPI003AF07FE0